MTIYDMTNLMQDGLIGLVIILLGLIKIPRLEVNFWGYIAKSIGSAINHDISQQINRMDSELKAHVQKTEEYRIKSARQRILRFSDDIMLEKNHSLEHYNDILDDIDIYEDYCDTHPGYINNKAEMAIELIRTTYQEHMVNHDFLVYTKRVG